MDPARILAVLRLQHDAIDLLLARVIMLDPAFLPTEAGRPWEAIIVGNSLIQELERESR